MKNILFLTDFSDGAKNAIEYTSTMYAEEETNYFVLFVNKVSNYTMSSLITSQGSVYQNLIGGNKQKLIYLCKQFEERYHKTYAPIVDYDTFIEAVKQISKLHNINLVVTGFNGTSNTEETIFGSNTLKLIRNIKTPLLIVPDHISYTAPKKVLYLLDEKDDLALMLNGSVLSKEENETVIIRVINNQNSQLKELDKALLNDQFSTINNTYTVVYDISLQHVKSYIMQTQNIDSTVLLVQDENFFTRLFQNNTTTKISKSLKKPLMILH
ncbi:hypothetical protein WH52_01135 [Tenacibaculum holothuriorum]|uniref:UspA domain-containing protein n=1 Tax=Tenacibaculum holothuriorum TaxID=1635173 RepID=A0A1Y2PHU1_9FLAO|nr:universal stress protein [Tenacibaculum holothuriorum]OSY89279.1 hypothetical protein WH52_01135 [Tenacibaculum holothuriorum]